MGGFFCFIFVFNLDAQLKVELERLTFIQHTTIIIIIIDHPISSLTKLSNSTTQQPNVNISVCEWSICGFHSFYLFSLVVLFKLMSFHLFKLFFIFSFSVGIYIY